MLQPYIESATALSDYEKEMLGCLNASLKSTETRDELSTTLYLQS